MSLLRDEGGPPATQDAGLLRRDRPERAPQDRGVVVAHRRDDGDRRVQCVRRIEPPAQADLDDRDGTAARGERAEREQERGRELDLERVVAVRIVVQQIIVEQIHKRGGFDDRALH